MSERFIGAITIEQASAGMLTLRGDLADPAFVSAIRDTLGTPVPGTRAVETKGEICLLWMSPDELLAVVPYEDAEALAGNLAASLGDTHSLVLNVSDARAMFRLTGQSWREVLAKGAPVDLAPNVFVPGQVRRTRLGQVAGAFWSTEPDSASLIVFRSVGDFVFDWLKLAAQPGTLPNFLTK